MEVLAHSRRWKLCAQQLLVWIRWKWVNITLEPVREKTRGIASLRIWKLWKSWFKIIYRKYSSKTSISLKTHRVPTRGAPTQILCAQQLIVWIRWKQMNIPLEPVGEKTRGIASLRILLILIAKHQHSIVKNTSNIYFSFIRSRYRRSWQGIAII